MSTKKRQLSLYAALSAWGLLVLAGCRMANDEPKPGSDDSPALYIAGSVYKNGTPFPCFWKNGVRTDLAVPDILNSGGSAQSIFVSGADIYIAGWIKQYTRNPDLGYVTRPCFWKNEERTDLELPQPTENGGEGLASSIFVANGDVYIAGSHSDAWNKASDSSIPCVWKNGNRIDLGVIDEPARAASIFVSGSDIYVAGETYLEKNWGTYFPCFWHNGTRSELNAVKDAGMIWESGARSIFVAGNDVYVAGYIQTWNASSGNRLTPCYWKNGIRSDLNLRMPAIKEWGDATAIFISGSDVYVAGNDNGQLDPISIPCYWKNGEKTELNSKLSTPNESYYGHASAIFVSAGDVYVMGQISSFPCYWINGVRTELSVADKSRGGSANGMVFVPGR